MSPEEAGRLAAKSGGRTIILSGVAVGLGFAGLVVVPLGELQSVGVGGLLVVTFAVLTSTTLVPGVLTKLGPSLEKLRVLRAATHRLELWRRWGEWVSSHPVPVLVAVGSPLLWLSWQGTQLKVGSPEEDWLPPSMESAQGLDHLTEIGRGAILHTARVIVQLPKGSDVFSASGWGAVRRLRSQMLADDRIAAVMSYTSFEGNGPMSRLRFLGIPRSLRNSYLSRDNHTVLLDAVPGEQVDPEAMVDFVHEFRQSLNGRHGREADVLFGGLPGVRADYHNSSSGHLPKVVLLVVSGTFLALAVGFRSLLIPVKAIALNLLSVGAGFGVVKLVFLDGFCLGALGLDQPVSAVFEIVPTLVFCIVFGLSMDYEVFLVARVAEAKRVGHSDRTAIVEGLTHSAPLITSASAIMVVVFGAFALGEFLVIQVLGIALAASIALDAALVRVAVGPALLALAGRWNWWPGIRLDSAPTGGHDVR